MGLDMYLNVRRTTYKPFRRDEAKSPERVLMEQAADSVGLTKVCDILDFIAVEREVAYWRKANQVHGWFVANVQDGRDECQRSTVEREQLVELRNLCAELLATRDQAQALEQLPPEDGFFFGGTEVDQYYWEDLERTVQQLDKALALPEDVTYVYQASW